MNKKPIPTDADVKDLAKRLKALWVAGQSVRPFLRQHAGLFRELQSQGWSWAGLALALNKAKLTYRTGKPWTADTLMQAFSRAQAPLQQHRFKAPAEPHKHDKNPTNVTKAGETAPATAGFDAPRLVADIPAAAIAPELVTPVSVPPVPQFKPFSLKPQELPPAPSQAETDERDALRRRMFGS